MAKKQQPELFSTNLFTSSSSGTGDSFAFGESSGNLPAPQILFAQPAAGSNVDPFASLSNPTSNDGTVSLGNSQGRSDFSATSQQAPGDVTFLDSRNDGVSGVVPLSTNGQASVGGSSVGGSTAAVLNVHPQQTFSGVPTRPEPTEAVAPVGYPQTVTPPVDNVATIPITVIGSGSTTSAPFLPAHVPQPQPYAAPPMFATGDLHQPVQHSTLSGPPVNAPALHSGFSGPQMGYSAAPATAGPPSMFGAGPSVMEPVEMTGQSANLVAFSSGGFPTQAIPAQPTPGAPQPSNWVSPPQSSAIMQPTASPVSVAGGVGTFPAFQQPINMNPLPVEQEWREQQEIVQNSVPPAQFHWFYCKAGKWIPFSLGDSGRLDEAYANSLNTTMDFSSFVPTDGGRYDVELETRQRHSVYWDSPACEVRRCSWFFKGDPASDFTPYKEEEAEALEVHYQRACMANTWPARFDFKGSAIHMHNPTAMVHLPPLPAVPGPVRRGLDAVDPVPEGEPIEVDHLVFVVHGVGPAADMRFRSIYECVDDWRNMTSEMLQQHFPHRRNRRVEFLPVAWHEALHGDTTGVNRKLRDITLGSCSRLRDFVNDFLLDVLFYMSPAYSQTIFSTVAGEMERMYNLFQSRHPDFSGEVSCMGHSLGSCILFDLLSHQGSPAPPLRNPESTATAEEPVEDADEDQVVEETLSFQAPAPITVTAALSMFGLDEFIEKFEAEKIDLESFQMMGGDDFKEIGVPMGPRKKLITYLRDHNQAQETYKRQLAEAEARKAAAAAARDERERRRREVEKEKANSAAMEAAEGIHRIAFQHSNAGIGMPMIRYPQLSFQLKSLYCLGSPIAMFVTVRGGTLGADFNLPTCRHLVNIFHPFDPVAYRVEPLVNLAANSIPPSLVPHHKGRKRLHLELRDNLGRVGANIKKNFLESMRYTWQAVQQFAASHSGSTWQEQVAKEQLEQQEKVHAELEAVSNMEVSEESSVDLPAPSVDMGKLNGGERIDYVLQEHPFESFNEYLFAMQSHLCYWTSEDSSLLVLRHLFNKAEPAPVQHEESIPS